MKYLIPLLGALAIVSLLMVGLGVKMIFLKKGEFKRHCSSVDPYTGERSGCVCGKTVMDNCKGAPKYHPLEVNKELMNEIDAH